MGFFSLTPTKPKYPPTTTSYDWEGQEGGYIPYRFQTAHRRRWRREDKAAYLQRCHDREERERNREVLCRHYDGRGEKEAMRVKYREEVERKRGELVEKEGKGEKKGRGKGTGEGEMITVYASPEIKAARR